jgi:hypothetical protein
MIFKSEKSPAEDAESDDFLQNKERSFGATLDKETAY